MKKDTIYYLKKHSQLVTSKKENTKAIIDFVDGYEGSDLVHGHYLDDPETTFVCCRDEFSEIFGSKPTSNG